MKNKFKLALMAFVTLLSASTMVSCGSDDDDIKPSKPETPTVTPISTYGTYGGTTYFKYPVMDWGASVSTVKSKMSGFTLNDETSTMLSYKAKYKEIATLYTIDSRKLKASAIGILSSSISTTALTSILGKDFTPVGKDEDTYSFYYVNQENKLACVLQLQNAGSTIYYLIAWFEFDSSTSRAADDVDIQYMNKAFEEIKSDFVLE